MARILADASRRAALIPRAPATARRCTSSPMRVTPPSSESVAARARRTPADLRRLRSSRTRVKVEGRDFRVKPRHVRSEPDTRRSTLRRPRDLPAPRASATAARVGAATGGAERHGRRCGGAGRRRGRSWCGCRRWCRCRCSSGAGSRGSGPAAQGRRAATAPAAPTRSDANDAGKATGSRHRRPARRGSGRSGGGATGPGKPMRSPRTWSPGPA